MEFPSDITKLIALELPPEKLVELCESSEVFHPICYDIYFQRQYAERWNFSLRRKYTQLIIDPGRGLVEAMKLYLKFKDEQYRQTIEFFINQIPAHYPRNPQLQLEPAAQYSIESRFVPYVEQFLYPIIQRYQTLGQVINQDSQYSLLFYHLGLGKTDINNVNTEGSSYFTKSALLDYLINAYLQSNSLVESTWNWSSDLALQYLKGLLRSGDWLSFRKLYEQYRISLRNRAFFAPDFEEQSQIHLKLIEDLFIGSGNYQLYLESTLDNIANVSFELLTTLNSLIELLSQSFSEPLCWICLLPLAVKSSSYVVIRSLLERKDDTSPDLQIQYLHRSAYQLGYQNLPEGATNTSGDLLNLLMSAIPDQLQDNQDVQSNQSKSQLQSYYLIGQIVGGNSDALAIYLDRWGKEPEFRQEFPINKLFELSLTEPHPFISETLFPVIAAGGLDFSFPLDTLLTYKHLSLFHLYLDRVIQLNADQVRRLPPIRFSSIDNLEPLIDFLYQYITQLIHTYDQSTEPSGRVKLIYMISGLPTRWMSDSDLSQLIIEIASTQWPSRFELISWLLQQFTRSL